MSSIYANFTAHARAHGLEAEHAAAAETAA